MWGIGLRADDPRANDPRQWRKKALHGEVLCAVREAVRESETGSAHPASSRQFCTPTGNAGIEEISSSPQPCPLFAASACQGPPSEFSTYCSDAPADNSHEGLAIASGVGLGLSLSPHGPCLIGGTVALDEVSFTTKIAIHSGGGAIVLYRCVALLDPGSPQTFIRRDVLDRMLLVGAVALLDTGSSQTFIRRDVLDRLLSVGPASAACERSCSPRSRGGFAEKAPFRTTTSIRLSVQLFRDNEPTCPLAVWACVEVSFGYTACCITGSR